MRRRGWASAALVAALGTACGSGGGSGTGAITASAIARDTRGTGSARFELRETGPAEVGPSGSAGRIVTSVMHGAIDFRAAKGELTTDPGPGFAFEMRWVGSRSYFRITVPPGAGPPSLATPSGKWVRSGGSDTGLTTIFRPDFLLDMLRSASRSGSTVGHDTVRGVAATHLRFVVDMRVLAERSKAAGLMPNNPSGAKTMTADVWVDGQGRLRRLSGSGTSAGPAGTSVIEFYDFGVHVDVEEPAASETTGPEVSTSGTP